MATTKKTSTKKVTKTKVAPVKQHKKPVRSRAALSSTSSRDQFMTLKVTRETVYWLIFGLVVIALAVQVLALTIRVQNLYDQIEVNGAGMSLVNVHKK